MSALYPSLKTEKCAKIISKTLEDVEVECIGVDYAMVGRTIAMMNTEDEIDAMGVTEFCPRRRAKKGPRPGLADTTVGGDKGNKKPKWVREKSRLPETPREKRVMIARLVESMVKLVFQSHVYTYGGKVFRQQDGGPIGLRLSGSVAAIVMIVWDSKMVELVEESGINMPLYARYVDDGNTLMEAFRRGWRWVDEEKRLMWKKEWENEDEEIGEEDDKRCFREWRRLCNSIWEFIVMKEDVPSNYPDNKLPILDLAVYCVTLTTPEGVQYTVPRFSFYEKPMRSQFTIHQETAMGEHCKVTTLTQEVIRRMRNISREASWEERSVVLTKFAVKMYVSKYREEKRREILVAGLKGYEKQLDLNESKSCTGDNGRGKQAGLGLN